MIFKEADKMNNKPIAVIDSGLGGVSVLKELVALMPNENFIYLADSLNAPYGTKTMQEVKKITVDNVKMLMDIGIKALVIACNTATGAAVKILREMYQNFPIIGIEPAIKSAVVNKQHPRVVVMATPLTLTQEKFENLVSEFSDDAEIIPLPCPGLMEIIESGKTEGEEIDSYLNNLLSDIDLKSVDSVVLGCTHYPHAQKAIKKAFGEGVSVFDGGEGTAKETLRKLTQAGLLNKDLNKGKIEFLNTMQDCTKNDLAKKLLYGE